MQPSALAKRVFPFAFLPVFSFYFYGLGLLPLLGPDEPRYAQVAREMFLRGDLTTPTLGGHNWFEKPALLYWLMMVAYKLFGVTEWSARIGPALCGLLTVASICFVSRRSDNETKSFSSLASFISATSLGLIVFARAASFDIVVTMTTAWALAFFLSQEINTDLRAKRWLLVGFYFCIGLSLLAKGLVGFVIPFGVLALYYTFRRRVPEREVRKSLVWGIPLAIAISAVWYGPVIAKHGRTFIDQFFIQHHFARFVSNKYHHPQRFYFYFSIIALMALPWTTVLTEEIAVTRLRDFQDNTAIGKTRTFALAWLVLPILFFSFSSSKLPGYILPAVPAAALLIADRIQNGNSRWTMRIAGVICLSLGITGLLYALRSNALPPGKSLLIMSPFLIGGAVSIVLAKWRSFSALVIGCSTVLALVLVIHSVAPTIAVKESARDLLRRADELGFSQTPIYARVGSDRTPEFYAAGRVVYGSDGEPITLDEFPKMREAAREQGGTILVFVHPDYIDLIKRSPDMQAIGTNGNVALIVVNVR